MFIQNQELVSLEMIRRNAQPVTRESDLALEGTLMTPARVETTVTLTEVMEAKSSQSRNSKNIPF